MKTFDQFQEGVASLAIKGGSKFIPALMTGIGAAGTIMQSKKKDKDVNITPRGLKNFEGNDAKNIFDLDLNTSKQESIVSKDKKGNATSYKLVLTVDANFTNKINNKNYEKKFTKETTFNSKNNKFELDQLKSNLEKNMISQILQDINIYLNIIRNDL